MADDRGTVNDATEVVPRPPPLVVFATPGAFVARSAVVFEIA